MQHSVIAIFLFFVVSTKAQQERFEHLSSWNTFILKTDIASNWSAKSEFNFRRTNFLKDWEQFVLRPSVQYNINENISTALGYTFTKNYSYSNFSTPLDNREQNIWQQLTIKQPFNAFSVSHRIRLEERFRDEVSVQDGITFIDGTKFSNRLRYRFIIEAPLFKKPIISVLVYDEVFLDFENTIQPKFLDQNWMFIGFRFRESEHIIITSGYHHINIPRAVTEISNHIWETSIIYAL